MEDEPVRPRLDVGEVADTPVVVGLAFGDQLVAPEELHTDAVGGHASAGVEHMRRDHACIFPLVAVAQAP
jgi:hypothetical protein